MPCTAFMATPSWQLNTSPSMLLSPVVSGHCFRGCTRRSWQHQQPLRLSHVRAGSRKQHPSAVLTGNRTSGRFTSHICQGTSRDDIGSASSDNGWGSRCPRLHSDRSNPAVIAWLQLEGTMEDTNSADTAEIGHKTEVLMDQLGYLTKNVAETLKASLQHSGEETTSGEALTIGMASESGSLSFIALLRWLRWFTDLCGCDREDTLRLVTRVPEVVELDKRGLARAVLALKVHMPGANVGKLVTTDLSLLTMPDFEDIMAEAMTLLRHEMSGSDFEAVVHLPDNEAFWAFVCCYEAVKLRRGLKESLDLGGASPVPVSGVRAIAQALSPVLNSRGQWECSSCRLRELGLSGAQIGKDGARALSEALQPRLNPDGTYFFNRTLAVLDLGSSGLGDVGAELITTALAPVQTGDGSWVWGLALKDLQMECNGIGNKGATAIAQALSPRLNKDGTWAFFPSLRAISLWGNDIEVEGIRALSDSLMPREAKDGECVSNLVLWELDLRCNPGVDDVCVLEDERIARYMPLQGRH